MARSDARLAIRTRLTTLGPALPLTLENTNDARPEPPSPYLYLEFLGEAPAVAGIVATGSHLKRLFGSFAVHVLVPRGTGLADVETHADAIADLFETVVFGDVKCNGVPRIDPDDEVSDDGVWFGRVVVVDFQHDWIG
jgi:hypothetical protein